MAKAANIQTTDAAAGNLLFLFLLEVVAVILRTVLFVIFHSQPPRFLLSHDRICYANVLLNTVVETTTNRESEWEWARPPDLDLSSGESIEGSCASRWCKSS